MANNRELSQLGSFINVDDSSRNIGIATTATPYVGIGTTNPTSKLTVVGDGYFYGTGVVTATKFVGDVTGTVTGDATGLTGNPSITVTNLTALGNVSIAGTLTYEDVTNVDAIGVVTARDSVIVGAGLSVVGVTTLASAGGITTTGGDLFVGAGLTVKNDINFSGNLYRNGQLFTTGVGVGIATVNPQSGIITGRVGVGFTDINVIGTGITVTGYGSTVVIDLSSIAAASAGTGGDDIIRLAIAFG
jgi:hypothetical protein